MSRPNRRSTHVHDDGIALFMIGMRVSKPWRPDLWLPPFLAMPRMLRELHQAKAAAERGEGEDPGFLGHRMVLASSGPTVIQWWRSTEDLFRYASAPGAQHRPAWRAFNERARKAPGAVGIWHETYAVPAGGLESRYVGLPPSGLAAATEVQPLD